MRNLIDHLPRLRRYARALTSERYSADALVHDTIERALARAKQYQPATRLDTWLFAIMHHLFSTHMRERAELARAQAALNGEDGAIAQGTEGDMLGLRDLDRALNCLPVDQREVLLLVGLEEMPLQDAALILEIAPEMVIARLSRARDRLRSLLDDHDRERDADRNPERRAELRALQRQHEEEAAAAAAAAGFFSAAPVATIAKSVLKSAR
ncbi:MAG: RNA polymerase sigma factor [Janthinobacterium lividum]